MKLLAGRVLALTGVRRSSAPTTYSHKLWSAYCCQQKRCKATITGIPLLETPFDTHNSQRIVFTDHHGQNHTFAELGARSIRLADELKQITGQKEERVAFLCPRDIAFSTTLCATWISGNVAVPLTEKHPENMLEYFLKHTEAKLVVTTAEFADKMKKVTDAVGTKLHVVNFDSISKQPVEKPERQIKVDNGLILFTSGTTGLPKGVLLTHKNLEDQVNNICTAWEITKVDSMLHVLPLHHTHGLIHALISPLAVGARCHMLDKFDAGRTWAELLSTKELRPNVLMAVPTVYTKLVEEFDKSFANVPSKVEFIKATMQTKMRLILSGSASLPVPVLERMEQITGHRILERYGMTEIGMALTNPLHGLRKPGFVGLPFKTVQLRIVDLESRDKYKVLAESNIDGTKVFVGKNESPIGDLLVKGPSVFKEYWKNPEATKKEFTHDGWFITGDTVEYTEGSYKILGRKSVDIIKSGGYKLSALEIETQLLALPEIREIAVCGLNDPTWGQKVAAMIVWNGKELPLNEFRELAKKRLPAYACPSVIKTLDELPKNQLGKVNKKELVKLF